MAGSLSRGYVVTPSFTAERKREREKKTELSPRNLVPATTKVKLRNLP